MHKLIDLISPLKTIVEDAGNAILEVYNADQPIEVDSKADDSPVTKADLAAHKVIEAGLSALPVNYPVLSEEGGIPEYEIRKTWTRYWLVDPLDGTKEFINRNGEFTVNVALIENGNAVLGMVYVPSNPSALLWRRRSGQLERGSGRETTTEHASTQLRSQNQYRR